MGIQKNILRLGSRKSNLALFQAKLVQQKLHEHGIDSEIITFQTTGDQKKDIPLYDIGGKALFAKELQQALLEDKIDLAVHSLKDLEVDHPPSLKLIATLQRDNPSDVFISRKTDTQDILLDKKIFSLGTCAPRRTAFIKDIFTQANVVPLRGNVETRLQKVIDYDIDATILSLAALQRLNIIEKYQDILDFKILDPHDFIPAACQGVIGIEGKNKFDYLKDILNHEKTFFLSSIEKQIIKIFNGSCSSAIGVYAKYDEEYIYLFIRFLNAKTDQISIKKFALHQSEITNFLKTDIFGDLL